MMTAARAGSMEGLLVAAATSRPEEEEAEAHPMCDKEETRSPTASLLRLVAEATEVRAMSMQAASRTTGVPGERPSGAAEASDLFARIRQVAVAVVRRHLVALGEPQDGGQILREECPALAARWGQEVEAVPGSSAEEEVVEEGITVEAVAEAPVTAATEVAAAAAGPRSRRRQRMSRWEPGCKAEMVRSPSRIDRSHCVTGGHSSARQLARPSRHGQRFSPGGSQLVDPCGDDRTSPTGYGRRRSR
jgi:hypothetical protein